jgi:predicted Ser/Thr protein kinase
MPESSDLLAAGIEPAGSGSPGGWTPPSHEMLSGVFPQLEILALIGHGGMGAVYKARQTHLDRLVAVKLLSAERGADPAFVERFTREARALARLQHPQIVTLYDFGRAGSWLYLVMEYVEGANLRQLLATGRLDPAAALRLVAPLCDALVHAHAQGVVHRDLKPENILIDGQGQPKIADFGLAKLRSAKGALTQTGDALGTLHYMSPEQVSGAGVIDHRADVYALGVILYEMLTGNLPLGRCLPPSQSGSDPRLDEVVLKSLEREPDKRWQTVDELRQAVAQIQAGMPTRPSSPAGRHTRKSKLAWGLVLAAALGSLALIFYRQEHAIVQPVPPLDRGPETTHVAVARLDEAVKETKSLETLLAAMELRKSEMERRVKELTGQAAQAEADATKASVASESARQQQAALAKEVDRLVEQQQDLAHQRDVASESARRQQAQLANDVERLTKQRQDLTQELDAATKTLRTKEGEAARSQEQADALAKELAGRLPGPAPAAPIRLELRYDRDAMSTIGHVVHADGSSEDLAPVPWPRDGAKVLVSAAKEVVGRQFTDLVVAHYQKIARRQRLIGELLVQADELARLDVSSRHVALIADLKRLGDEKP